MALVHEVPSHSIERALLQRLAVVVHAHELDEAVKVLAGQPCGDALQIR